MTIPRRNMTEPTKIGLFLIVDYLLANAEVCFPDVEQREYVAAGIGFICKQLGDRTTTRNRRINSLKKKKQQ